MEQEFKQIMTDLNIGVKTKLKTLFIPSSSSLHDAMGNKSPTECIFLIKPHNISVRLFWGDFVTLLDFGVGWDGQGQEQGLGLGLGLDNI